MAGDYREVQFGKYCSTCVHKDVSENNPEGACWDCLEEPLNIDSEKPVGYKPAE